MHEGASAPAELLRHPDALGREEVSCAGRGLEALDGELALLRDRAGGPFEVLLSPADMIAPSMTGQIEDHLARMFAHLGPVAAAVLLADIAPDAQTAERGLFSACRLGAGILPLALVSGLLAEHVPAETPVILLPGAVDEQRAALGL